jgi:hypothetical protein
MYILVMPRFFVVAGSFSLDIFSLLSAVAAQIRADPIDQGILIEGEGSGTIDFLVKVACFVLKVSNIFIIENR